MLDLEENQDRTIFKAYFLAYISLALSLSCTPCFLSLSAITFRLNKTYALLSSLGFCSWASSLFSAPLPSLSPVSEDECHFHAFIALPFTPPSGRLPLLFYSSYIYRRKSIMRTEHRTATVVCPLYCVCNAVCCLLLFSLWIPYLYGVLRLSRI